MNNKIDLGTLLPFGNAEMYKDYLNLKEKEKYNTFQQKVFAANVGAEPQRLPSAAPSAQGVRESHKTGKNFVGITPNTQNVDMISKDDIYHSITVQMGKIKIGNRCNRADIYPSLMRDTDSMYKIKLTCDATDEISEIQRGASQRVNKKTGKVIQENRYILNLIEDYKAQDINGIMMGRLRYRAQKNFVSNFNRQNIPYALLVLFPSENNTMICNIHLYTEMYTILLTNDLTVKQKQSNYVLTGTYTNQDLPDLDE